MSDYGDDDIDWGDPTLLAQLDSLETDAATKSSSTANAPNSTLYALQRQPAAPRASQIPPGNVAGASGAAAAANAAPGSTAARRNGGGGHSTLLRTGAATGAAFPTPSQYGNAKPSGILRPPKPPVRAPKPPAPNGVNGTRPLQGAPAAAATAAQDRKPHLARANSAQGGQEADEEDLPAITVDENASATGTGSMYRAEPQRGVTIARPAAAAQRAGSEPSEKDSGARAQSRPTGPVAAPQSGAGRPSAAVPPQAPGPAAIRLQPVHVTSHEQVPRPATAAIQAPQPPPQPAPRGPAVAAGFAAPATAGPNGNAHSTTAPSHAQNAVAGGSGLSAQDREELAALRREKAKMQEALEAATRKTEEMQRNLYRREGENTLIRTRLTKAEQAYAQRLQGERRDKELVVEQLKAKERDYARVLQTMRSEASFRKIEVESSGGRGSASAMSRRTYRAGSSQRPSSQQPRGPSAAPETPTANRRAPASAHRTSRAATEQPVSSRPPPPAGPVFSNFQNSFAVPSSTASRRPETVVEEREGSMGPPQVRLNGKEGKRQAPATPPSAAPAAKRRKDETDPASPANRSPGRAPNGAHSDVDEGGDVDMADEAEADQPWPWVWVKEEKDTRGDLLAAVFAHITFGAVDVEPAVLSGAAGAALPPHRLTASSRSGAPRTSLPGTAGNTRTSARHRTQNKTGPALPVSHGPQPTIYALSNIRFPATTPAPLVERYEAYTRDLFSVLGHSHDSRQALLRSQGGSGAVSEASQRASEAVSFRDPEAGPLAFALATTFTSMLRVLDAATLTGAMTALLRLVSHLAFLSPTFALACCGAETTGTSAGPTGAATQSQRKAAAAPAPTALLPLTAHIIAKYGRPSAAEREKEALAGTGSSASTSTRPRRARVARSLGGRRSGSTAGATGGGRGKPEPGLVDTLEPAKRTKLLETALALLEGVTWKCLVINPASNAVDELSQDVGSGLAMKLAEDMIVDTLAVPNAIATLLDPAHSTDLLLLGTRFLCMLACHRGLFRRLVGLKFYDLPDVKSSRLPLIDRIAFLLSAPRTDSASAYQLDLALISFSTLLLGAHEEANLLVAHSNSFIHELLFKTWQDVRTLWEWDGRVIPTLGRQRDFLNRTTHRLSRLVRLFYYIALAPHAPFSIHDLVAGPDTALPELSSALDSRADAAQEAPPQRRSSHQRQAAHDALMTAFGMLAFATLNGREGISSTDSDGRTVYRPDPKDESSIPSWAEPGSKERRTLVELGFLAQEILGEVSPDELEEIEVCFGTLEVPVGGQDEADGGDGADELEILEVAAEA